VPPASVSGWKAAAIAATTSAPWPSGSRSPTRRCGSWDRNPNSCAPWSPPRARNPA
jgi:hypothetical protein